MGRRNVPPPTGASSLTTDVEDYSWCYDWADADQFPLTAQHLDDHEGYFPDPMCDDGHLRKKRGKPIMTAFEKLQVLSPDLILCTALLPDFKGRTLYAKATIEAARKLAQSLILKSGSLGGVWKLERGRNRVFHLHLVIAADSDISDFDHWTVVDDLEGLAGYLSKPADACAVRREPVDLALYSAEELDRQRLQASEEWLGRERLPKERFRYWGTKGLRQIPYVLAPLHPPSRSV